jgi:hypothetical protein
MRLSVKWAAASRWPRLLVALALATFGPAARADDASPADEIAAKPYFRLESAIVRSSFFDQHGHGYQSRAGPPGGPGDETLFVWEPEIEVVIAQGQHLTHTVSVPVDIVSAASPDAVDVTSEASRQNEAAALDWTATYKTDTSSVSLRSMFHAEENYRSWLEGLVATHGFADDNTVLAASLFSSIDYFEKYLITGPHHGHSTRSALNANVSLTQLLSPTTVVVLGYGFTVQTGDLSNNFNTVPLTNGRIEFERLPSTRDRHALSARLAQYLPWSGALKLAERFYVDDWGVIANTVEGELDQRLTSFSYLGGVYRAHRQNGVDFFTTRADPGARLATADSDLAPFWAQTVGGKLSFDWSVRSKVGTVLHFDFEADHYFRTNDLRVNVVSCSVGFLH